MASNRDFEVDLTNCDREPIHALGAVQPFGFLLALSVDWLIRRVSANAEHFLEQPADDLLGTSAIPLLGEHAVHTLRNRLAMLRGADAVERVFGLRIASGRCFDFALHMIGDTIVLEGEDCSEDASTDIGSAIRAMMARLDETADAAAFHREGARQVRALTGFDRVMVYRFDRDGSGVVVAEAARTGIGSFLDLRYPASDIPQQARKLYVRTPFRIIADVNAEPVPVLPRLDESGTPIDLSLSVLRSVSPIHIEYLKNMGVGASLSISIIVEGQLWGLFACHHYAARCPSFERRSIAELFGQMFALKLESRERKELAAYELAARSASDRLLAAVAGDSTLLDNPEWLGTMMRETVPCDGIAIWLDGRVSSSGMTPPPAAFPAITRRLNAMAAGRIFSTDRLADTLPAAAGYDDVAAGLLAIPISRRPRDYVLLFRQEKIRTVRWAGDPHKPAQLGPNGPRLTPRKSFELWSQEVRGRSEPFSNAELRVAEMLRASLIEVVLRLSDEAQEERRRFSERQELLIAELNHRVRNILSLIRGLVRQSLDPEADARNTIHLLEGRIESLARAHDQITQDNWSAAPLLRLIETEAAAYLAGKAGRVEADGPAVLLHPQAFSALALVLHELMTNSAKYGALSDNGSVAIDWRIERDGDLAIAWRERGGPAVQPPKRQGFGTTIITRSIPYDLGGRAEVRYPLTGLEADFRVPARYIEIDSNRAGHPAAAAAPAPGTAAPMLLSGVVLLVEDSLIIAMDAEDILTRLGAHRVVTAGTLAQAREEIARETFEAAVLDVNLGAETSLPLADDLTAAGVPFLFATGYGEQLKLPSEHAAALVTQKPYTLASISRAISDLLSMQDFAGYDSQAPPSSRDGNLREGSHANRRIGGEERRQRPGGRAGRPAPPQRLARRHGPEAASDQRRMRHAHHCGDHRLPGAGAGRSQAGRPDRPRRQDLARARRRPGHPPAARGCGMVERQPGQISEQRRRRRPGPALPRQRRRLPEGTEGRGRQRHDLRHAPQRPACAADALQLAGGEGAGRAEQGPCPARPGYPVGSWRPRQVEGRRAGDVRPVPDRLRALAHFAPYRRPRDRHDDRLERHDQGEGQAGQAARDRRSALGRHQPRSPQGRRDLWGDQAGLGPAPLER